MDPIRFLDIVRRGEEENRKLFGPFFIGAALCFFLWGIQIAQSYYYYRTYRHTDGKLTKGAVLLLFVLDAIQTVCTAEGTWRYTVEAWGDQGGFALISNWGNNSLPLTDSAIISLVHVFYAHKLWSLCKAPYNYIVTGIVLSFSSLQLVGGSGASVFFLSIHNNVLTLHRGTTWVMIWLVASTVTDVVIAAAMSLRLAQSRTGFKKTDDIISKLIHVVIETGVATAVTQVIDIILYLGFPQQAYHTVPASIGPKFYSNSMLALLNSRPVPKTTSKGDSIQIHTTSQTYAIHNDYELRSGATGGTHGAYQKDPPQSFMDVDKPLPLGV